MIEKDVKVFVSVAERDHDCDAMSGETRLRRVESARLDAGVVKRLDYFQRLFLFVNGHQSYEVRRSLRANRFHPRSSDKGLSVINGRVYEVYWG